MGFEIPKFKRCCFCVPLRYGLLSWAYLMLVPYALTVFVHVYFYYQYAAFSDRYSYRYIIMLILFTMIMVCNFGFTILLIVAAHKKSPRLLKIYYMGALVLAISTFVLLTSELAYDFASWISVFYTNLWFWRHTFVSLLMVIIFVGMQLYIITLVRSEILKLENNCSFQFTNNAAEAERAYNEAETIKIEDNNVVNNEQTNNQTDKTE